MLLGLRSRRPCSEPGRTRTKSSPTLRSDFTRGDAATHRWTCGSWARPGTCDPPGSAEGTTALQTNRNPEAAVRSREALKTAGGLTVRMTPAPSHDLHRLGDHSLREHRDRAGMGLGRRLIFGRDQRLGLTIFSKLTSFSR